MKSLTCVEGVDINAVELFEVGSTAKPAEGVDDVSNGHCGVVDTFWTAVQLANPLHAGVATFRTSYTDHTLRADGNSDCFLDTTSTSDKTSMRVDS